VSFSEILHNGFAAAHHRFGLIFIDILWKAIWLGATLAGMVGVFAWFNSQLQSIAWQDTGVPALNGLLAVRLLQEFWDAHRGALLSALVVLWVVSAAAWFFLEAFFRTRFVPVRGFALFLVSGVVKAAILAAAGSILGVIAFGSYLTTPLAEWPGLWPETRAVAVAAGVTFAALAFLLTLFETLVRSDAIILLGTDLIRLAGVLGILLLFEVMIGASVVMAVLAGFLIVSRASEALMMLGIAGLSVLFLSLLHSYLLLVRFSAVNVMRRNVFEICNPPLD
jgi:hypothetical protein